MAGLWLLAAARPAEAVVPVVVGPLQALLALLPSILLALGGALLAIFRPSGVKKLVRFLWHQKLFTVLLVGVAAAAVVLGRHGWGRGGPAATEAKAGTDWPAFRGGPERRGAVPGAPDPSVCEPVWSFDRDARTVYASPAVVGNRLYVSTADKGVFADRGAILCLDAQTGAEVWRYAPKDFRATFSSPAVKDGYVVCGEGLHFTTDARITCLDLEGNRLWELRTASHVESSPCIYDGRVYIGAGDDGYYCIDLEPGPDGQPDVLWHLDGEDVPDCESCPAALDGVVYVGLGQGGNAILALDAETGEVRWRLDTPYPVFSPPALAEGKLYVGMGNGNFIETAEQVRAAAVADLRDAGASEREIAEAEKRLGPAGEVWCIDLQSRQVAWCRGAERTVLGAVAVAGDRLYFGSRDGTLHCLSTGGKPLGRWHARSPITTSPAVGAGHVYFVTVDGRLHCLKAQTLEPVWDMLLGKGTNFLGSPTLALGHVYVGTAQDGLRCIGRPGEKPVPLWSGGERGGWDRSPLPERGGLVWRFPRGAAGPITVTGPLMVLGDALYVPCSRADRAGMVRLRLDPDIREDSGRMAWTAALERPVVLPPGGVGAHLYVVSGEPGEPGLVLHCLAAEDGRQRWRMPLEGGASGRFALSRRHLTIWTGPQTLTCLPAGTDERPRPLWARRLGAGRVAPAPGQGILVAATDGALLALDDSTGTPLWQVGLDDPPLFGPLRRDKRILLPTRGGLAAHRIVDGRREWTHPLASIPGFFRPPVAGERQVHAVTAASTLLSLDLEGGRELRGALPAWPRVQPLWVGDGVLYAARELMFLGADAEEPRQWARTGWLGRFLTPLILHDSHVYFATDKYGVICLGRRRR
ncbi:MAG: PQQ-binding-like beta-propeller repeat protein [Candidatus Brocadiia bacterium]